jgi:uncharacterized protein (TIGR02466 family)
MPGTRSDWFPTSVWHFDLADCQQMNANLLQAINQEKARDGEGLHWSNSLGWHSADNLHQRDRFKDLMAIASQNATEVAQTLAWDLDRYAVVISNCWAIANGKHASNFLHNHPNSFLSGVYYVTAPEKCGGLFFRDPRDLVHMFPAPILNVTPWTLQKVTYQPLAGRMLIFPSWLMHGVEPNLNTEERVSISFNISLTAKPQP